MTEESWRDSPAGSHRHTRGAPCPVCDSPAVMATLNRMTPLFVTVHYRERERAGEGGAVFVGVNKKGNLTRPPGFVTYTELQDMPLPEGEDIRAVVAQVLDLPVLTLLILYNRQTLVIKRAPYVVLTDRRPEYAIRPHLRRIADNARRGAPRTVQIIDLSTGAPAVPIATGASDPAELVGWPPLAKARLAGIDTEQAWPLLVVLRGAEPRLCVVRYDQDPDTFTLAGSVSLGPL